jgi:hypothetical protein
VPGDIDRGAAAAAHVAQIPWLASQRWGHALLLDMEFAYVVWPTFDGAFLARATPDEREVV